MSRIDDGDYDVESFKNRLNDYSKTICKSFRDFEDRCGLSHAGIASIGKQGPTTSYLAKIADTCPELNLNWLIRGDGKMLLTDNLSSDQSETKIDVHHNTVNIGNVSEFRDLFRDVLQEIMKGK